MNVRSSSDVHLTDVTNDKALFKLFQLVVVTFDLSTNSHNK